MFPRLSHGDDGVLLVLAWPDTWVGQAGSLYDKPMRWVGINKDNRYKAGHAALATISKTNGAIEYFDFGRYITPSGKGRVRSHHTDSEVIVPVIGQFKKQLIPENIEEILLWLHNMAATHGEGPMYASVCHDINFGQSRDYIYSMIEKGSMDYGPFMLKASNCSRFVADAVRAGAQDTRLKRNLRYTQTLTPSPLGNVINASTVGPVWKAHNGKLTHYHTHRFKVLQQVMGNFWPGIQGPQRSCQHKLQGSLTEPERPAFMHEKAQWLGGTGAGAWFELTRYKTLNPNEYRFRRIGPDGVVDCDNVFTPKTSGFDYAQPFKIVYDSNCRYSTVQQNGSTYIFTYLHEFGQQASGLNMASV